MTAIGILMEKTAMLKILRLALFAFVCLAVHSEESAYEQAIACLRDAQTDHSKLVLAIKLLGEAAENYEKSGNQEMGKNVNSCLYWARKKLTLEDIETLQNSSASKRLEVAAKSIPVSEAQAMLAKADAFAGKQDDPLLVAIRYFEVADRFPDSEYGRKAMAASLAWMQKTIQKPEQPAAVAVPTPEKQYQDSVEKAKVEYDLAKAEYDRAKAQYDQKVSTAKEAFASRLRAELKIASSKRDNERIAAINTKLNEIDPTNMPRGSTQGASKTDLIGDTDGIEYRQVMNGRAYLTGMKVKFGEYMGAYVVNGMQVTFLTAQGDKNVQIMGGKTPKDVKAETKSVVAKPGYAIGQIEAMSKTHSIYGFKVLFCKIKGDTLDRTDSYESEWIGGKFDETQSQVINKECRPIIGVYGKTLSPYCMSFGLVFSP